MKYLKYLLAIIAISFILGCSEKLPENYGIYASTENGLITLKNQKVSFVGNLFMSITGLKSASGAQFNSIKNFIVFEKDINPKHIRISRLEFKKGANVETPFGGSTYWELKLWTVASNIDFDTAPVKDKKDMYKLTPKTPLTNGFYALHFGGLENKSTIEATLGDVAYDFVIGKLEDVKTEEEKLATEAGNLLRAMNNYFNTKEYAKIKEIYRPNGNQFSDPEWQEFTKGLSTWLGDAGRIKESKIIGSNINETTGVFEVQTTYDKKGMQTERLVVQKIGQGYFITSLE